MTSYGLPYKGSKNKIAKWVVDNLPKANTLVEPFFGGGAITHCAIERGQYNNYIANDLRGTANIFLDVIKGKRHDLYTRFVWPDEFNREKHDDLLLALIWSFSNNEHTYLYGPKWIDYKYAAHKAIVDNDFEPITKYYADDIVKLLQSKLEPISELHDRRLCWSSTVRRLCRLSTFRDNFKADDLCDSTASLRVIQNLQCVSILQNLECVSRLLNLERVSRLQNLEYVNKELSFKPFKCDYRDIQIPSDSVVYCDPPYVNTSGYKGADEFDSKAFLDWAVEVGRNNPIYISEYQIDDPRFVCVAEKARNQTAAGHGHHRQCIEKLYTVK